MEIRTKRRILVSFLFFLPFTLLLILTILLFALSSALRTSNGWVEHTLEVKNAVRNLFGHMLEAESATRGFLLTHNPTYLADKEIADRAEADLSRIERLTKDNSRQQQSVAALRPLVEAKLDFLKRVTDLQNEKSAAEARTLFSTHEGKEKMDAIRPIVRDMENEEDRLLELRQDRAQGQSRVTRSLGAILLLVDLCALGVIAMQLRKMKQFEELVTVCAWTKTIQHQGRWMTFEQYLQKRFGISVTHGISRAAYDKLRAGVDTEAVKAA